MLPGHHDPEVRGDRYVESLIPIPDPGGRAWNEASRVAGRAPERPHGPGGGRPR